MNTYLQFASSAELLDHLRQNDGGATVHLDIAETHSDIGHGLALISIYAVLSQKMDDYVALYGTLIHRAQDMDITGYDERTRAAREKFRREIDERLARLRAQIEADHFSCQSGVWTHEAPLYLRKAL